MFSSSFFVTRTHVTVWNYIFVVFKKGDHM